MYSENNRFGLTLFCFLSVLIALSILSKKEFFYKYFFSHKSIEKVIIKGEERADFDYGTYNFIATGDSFRLFRTFNGPPFPINEKDILRTNNQQRLRSNFWGTKLILLPNSEVIIKGLPPLFNFDKKSERVLIDHTKGAIIIHSKGTSVPVSIDNEFFNAGPLGTIYASIKTATGHEVITLRGSVWVKSKNHDWYKSVTPRYRAVINPPNEPVLLRVLPGRISEILGELIDMEITSKHQVSGIGPWDTILQQEMRKMEYAQEEYRFRNGEYAEKIGFLGDYTITEGVEIEILRADKQGYEIQFKMLGYNFKYILNSNGERKKIKI